jgi:hypothetical protein
MRNEDGGPSPSGTAVRPALSGAAADRLERRCPRLGGPDPVRPLLEMPGLLVGAV